MILQVSVSKELIEQWFTTGHELRGVLRVKEGLPPGASLLGVAMGGGEDIRLLFEAQGAEDELFRSLPIIVERNREEAELQESLAYAHAIICVQTSVDDAGDGWSRIDPDDVDNLEEEVRYLELRGLLERHATDPLLVKLGPDVVEVKQVDGEVTP